MSTISNPFSQFAFALYRAVAEEQRGNLVIAPLPFSIAFSLLLNGADPATQRELLQITGLAGSSLDEINRQNSVLQKVLQQLNHEDGQTFVLANSLWASLPLSFSPAFLEAGRRFYSTEIASVPRAELPEKVSRWAREKTRDLIDMRLQETDFALLIATYFKGKWKYPFSEQETRPEDFHPEDGGAQKVPMMSLRGEFAYFEAPDFHVVALPYANATMYFLAPKPDLLFRRHSIHRIEQRALRDAWILTQPFVHRPGLVKIPRFKLRYDGEFIPALKKLGLRRLFDSFDSLRPAVTHPDGAKVTGVLQNSTITVDEKGAEAASVLAMPMAAGAAFGWKPPRPFEFIADRPFCFWIMGAESILFAGRVAELP
jgi:serpin B